MPKTPQRPPEFPILLHGRAEEILPTLRTQVACVITDPPYGIAYKNNRHDLKLRKYSKTIESDDSTEIGQRVIDLCFEKGWPVCAFAHPRSPWAGNWRQYLVWDKGPTVGAGGDPSTCWKFSYELIQVGGFGKLNGPRDSSVLKFWVNQLGSYWHPTQKDVFLLGYLIEKLTQPGDVILDPFMGSGSTGVACQMTRRKFVGIECDSEYFEVAEKRILRPKEATLEFMNRKRRLV